MDTIKNIAENICLAQYTWCFIIVRGEGTRDNQAPLILRGKETR